jgi:hypothetical protein
VDKPDSSVCVSDEENLGKRTFRCVVVAEGGGEVGETPGDGLSTAQIGPQDLGGKNDGRRGRGGIDAE